MNFRFSKIGIKFNCMDNLLDNQVKSCKINRIVQLFKFTLLIKAMLANYYCLTILFIKEPLLVVIFNK